MNQLANSMIPTHTRPSVLDRLLRDRLVDRLRGLRHGRLVLHDAWGDLEFGEAAEGTPIAHVMVDDASFYRAVARHGSVGAGDAYGEGHWYCDDLVSLVRLLVRNRDLLDDMERGMARLGSAALKLWHAGRRNTRAGSRRNIAGHYDLGNAFFRTFLSADMMYSSAYWRGADDTLEQASSRKL